MHGVHSGDCSWVMVVVWVMLGGGGIKQQPSLPVIPDPNPAAPLSYGLELHDTAARFPNIWMQMAITIDVTKTFRYICVTSFSCPTRNSELHIFHKLLSNVNWFTNIVKCPCHHLKPFCPSIFPFSLSPPTFQTTMIRLKHSQLIAQLISLTFSLCFS